MNFAPTDYSKNSHCELIVCGPTFSESLKYIIAHHRRHADSIYWVEVLDDNGTLWRDCFSNLEDVSLVKKILESRPRARVNVEHKNPTVKSLCRKLLGLPIDTPRFRKDPVLWRRFCLASTL